MSLISWWCIHVDRNRCARQGPWAPRKIANPHHFVDDAPLSKLGKIGAAAVEIWTMDMGYYFDNVLVASSPATAAAHRERHWAPKLAAEVRGRPARAHACMRSCRGPQPRITAHVRGGVLSDAVHSSRISHMKLR